MPIWDTGTGRGAAHFKELRLRDVTGAIAETVFFTEPGFAPDNRCATSRVTVYLGTTQAGTGGQLKMRLKWTDNSGVTQTLDTVNIQTNILGDVTSYTFVVHPAYAADVKYELIETGAPTGYKYDLFLHAEHM